MKAEIEPGGSKWKNERKKELTSHLVGPFDRLLTMRPNGYRSRDRWDEATASLFASKTHSQLQIKEEGT